MSQLSDKWENLLADAVFRGVSLSMPTTVYLALSSTSPDDTTTGSTLVEPSTGSYARVAITCNTTTGFSATNANNSTANPSTGTTGTIWNLSNITFPTSTAAWLSSASLAYYAVCDASTTGNIIVYGTLTNPQVVNGAGVVVQFAPQTLSIQIDN